MWDWDCRQHLHILAMFGMTKSKGPQRMYLEKYENENDNIYVDVSGLPQHQCEGIRFLHRQYKKGKMGVILNDPPGFGKRIQTVLFLNAVLPHMKQPALIICNEGFENVWTDHFLQWSKIDVAIQRGSGHTNAPCVVARLEQAGTMCRRDWGAVVMDDQLVSREALRSIFRARFKIWITSFDMKKHLRTFSLMYKWMFPRDEFVMENFEPDDDPPPAAFEKLVKLDAFMEHVVLRRKEFTFPISQRYRLVPNQRVSRKHKDDTGKKIKRSKPLRDDGHNTSTESQETGSEQDLSQEIGRKGEVEREKENQDVDDTGPKVKRSKALQNDGHNTSAESQETGSEQDLSQELGKKGDVNHDKESQEDVVVNIANEDETKIDEYDTDDILKDVTSNRNKVVVTTSKDNDGLQDKSDEAYIDLKLKDDEVPKSDTQESFSILNTDNDSENIVLKYNSETQDNEIEASIPAKKSKITNEMNVSEDLFSADIVLSDTKSDKVNIHDTNAKANNNKLTSSENIFSKDLPINEANDEIKTDDLNPKDDELVNKKNLSENKKTDPQLSGLDLQIKEMEERALKKFEGSFLDRMLN